MPKRIVKESQIDFEEIEDSVNYSLQATPSFKSRKHSQSLDTCIRVRTWLSTWKLLAVSSSISSQPKRAGKVAYIATLCLRGWPFNLWVGCTGGNRRNAEDHQKPPLAATA
jgi:hypothetical protein